MTRKAVGNARLAKLATYLEETKFKKGKFHLATWMGSYRSMFHACALHDPMRPTLDKLAGQPDTEDTVFTTDAKGDTLPMDCKTAGCAIGWAIAGIPSFRKAGLKYVNTDRSASIRYGYDYDFNAVSSFFALSDDVHVGGALFAQEYYSPTQRADPKAVAKRIRVYLAGGEQALFKVAKRTAAHLFRN